MHHAPEEPSAQRPPPARSHPVALGRKSMRRACALSAKLRRKIVKLHKLGFGQRRIQKKTGVGRKAVSGLLRQLGYLKNPQAASRPKASKLDPFRELVQEKARKQLTTSRILRELRQAGYQGGRTILALYVKKLRPRSEPRRRVFRRFETRAGREMQVDWSPYRVELGAQERLVHAFGAILAFSRKEHIRFYPDEREATLLEAHTHAFEDFQGVTEQVVYDRMATVVLGTIGKDRQPLWNPRFLEFAQYYGYEPFLCKPKDPDRKGKKEKFFQYLERDFLRGERFDSFQDLNARARVWLDGVANPRIHGTTRGVPDQVFAEQERPFLIRLPDTRYLVAQEETRKVGPDSVLSIRGTSYTVPATLANQSVRVRLFAERFEVLGPANEVAFAREYAGGAEKGRLQIDPSHYQSLRPRGLHRSPAQLEEYFTKRFPELADLMTGIRLSMKSLASIHLRALARMADTYGEDAFRKAALRAQSFHRHDAYAVRRILEQSHPLPIPEPKPGLTAEARVLGELGEVDGGTLDDYARLDTSQPALEPDHPEPGVTHEER